ncbi:MAG: hypothetical protein IJY83_00090 [Oscillospiraceae bacterium]|nr:hypothetical protein [Oscillospiraceae bacterium]
MDIELENVSQNILNLGLGALAHANRHAAYYDDVNDKWGELSVLQAAHAAELLVKARIAQVHPLLIFSNLPSVSNQDTLSIDKLAEDGRTIEWSDLPKVFKTITSCNFENDGIFKSFGRLRNSVQHFGIIPNQATTSASLETLRFIYSFIDPFINEHWGLYAIDYDEDMDSYEHLPSTLIGYEIKFLVSPEVGENSEFWINELDNCSDEYKHIMRKRIQDALNGGENNAQ